MLIRRISSAIAKRRGFSLRILSFVAACGGQWIDEVLKLGFLDVVEQVARVGDARRAPKEFCQMLQHVTIGPHHHNTMLLAYPRIVAGVLELLQKSRDASVAKLAVVVVVFNAYSNIEDLTLLIQHGWVYGLYPRHEAHEQCCW